MPSSKEKYHKKEKELLVEGIGLLAGSWLPVVGLWGGILPVRNKDGWSLLCSGDIGQQEVFLKNESSKQKWLIDKPITEVRALGFSTSGKLFVLATSSEVTIYSKVA